MASLHTRPLRTRIRPFSTLPLVILLLLAPVARAEPPDDVADDILFSDLPLFGHGGDDEWPRGFEDEESFGCVSRVAFGDWVFRESASPNEDAAWYRFSNYGVFHCFANTGHADQRAGLDGADVRPGFFVKLGTVQAAGHEIELWTIQIGARPGSEYLLLSREPAGGMVERFDVLQIACPRANVRDGGNLDVLLTSYCAIHSRRELVRLARRMALLPPLGSLARMPEAH